MTHDDRERMTERLAAALALAVFDAHPVYGNTAGWRGGIGGAAMTAGCSMTDPPPGDEWMDAGYGMLSEPLRDYLRAREQEGRPLDLDAGKATLAAELRASLMGEQRENKELRAEVERALSDRVAMERLAHERLVRAKAAEARHAALVADLRGLADDEEARSYLKPPLLSGARFPAIVSVDALRAVLDKHAGNG